MSKSSFKNIKEFLRMDNEVLVFGLKVKHNTENTEKYFKSQITNDKK